MIQAIEQTVVVNGEAYRIKAVAGPLTVGGETLISRVRHDRKIVEVDAIVPATDRVRAASLAVAYARRCCKFRPIRVVGIVD